MYLKEAKLAYLLSTCHKFADKIFTKLIKKHEASRVACTKYYYNLKFTLDIPQKSDAPDSNSDSNSDNNSRNFELKRVEGDFLYSSWIDELKNYDVYKSSILDDLNTLSAEEKNQIKTNYLALLKRDAAQISAENEDVDDQMDLYTIINLIKMYENKYNYLFIPCILDYSQDVGLVHQCALIVDLKNGLFLFLDPYGSYIKYEHDYAHPIKTFLNIYKDCLSARFITNGADRIRFNTFHEHLFSKREGIQSIILNSNNASSTFAAKKDSLLESLKESIPDLFQKINRAIEDDKNPVNKTDNTIHVLTILDNFEKYSASEEERVNFDKLWESALELYYLYNSKTCVSITLVEMNAFFSNVDLVEFYNRYRVETPNKVLLGDIYKLVEELDTEAVAHIEYNVRASAICKKIS